MSTSTTSSGSTPSTADNVTQARASSQEFRAHLGDDDEAWATIRPLTVWTGSHICVMWTRAAAPRIGVRISTVGASTTWKESGSMTMTRSDVVGSLLRPTYLLRAREQVEAGKLDPTAFKAIEDRAVDEVIAMQEGVGLDVVTDGEVRRYSFIDQLVSAMDGLTPDPKGDHIPVPFYDDNGDVQSNFSIPMSVTGKLQRRRMVTVEEFAYTRGKARRPVKVTLPSPLLLFLVWSPTRSKSAYADPFEMFADGTKLLQEEIQELARLGCQYIQIDAPDIAQLVDESQRNLWKQAGISVDRVLTEGVEMLNQLAVAPGVTFGLHLCKGNHASNWISAGGYESISKQVFKNASNYDVFMLEYDDDRSGSFAPLKDLPEDKVAVLGLVSSKVQELEAPGMLMSRIDEASKYFPRAQMALSTQCGFSSAGPGNNLTKEDQEKKLRLVADVAAAVWH
ncbi:cobalamin-independent methionine synthase II family protein [Streptomyces sp. NPDC005708]|uniref:cobalamin-independent methionine synthase II family protein n=1 Tax=Streptomyces sp. NPDC005708 TaxID=3154564 RepID=UPI0033DB0C83